MISDKNMIEVSVREFTTIPGPRFRETGDYSAEEFFDVYLKPKIDEAKDNYINIDFSGTWGYGPSFTSQLGIYIVEALGESAIDKVTAVASDDPEVVDRFYSQLKEAIDEMA